MVGKLNGAIIGRSMTRKRTVGSPTALPNPLMQPTKPWLAEDGRVAAATQTQAASAIVLLYRDVLWRPLGRLESLVRARKASGREARGREGERARGREGDRRCTLERRCRKRGLS